MPLVAGLSGLGLALAVQAAPQVNVDVYLDGELQQHVTLAGLNSTCSFPLKDAPETSVELRLIAPEPLIIQMKEKAPGASPEAVGRIKLLTAGSTASVSPLPGSRFQRQYVFVKSE